MELKQDVLLATDFLQNTQAAAHAALVLAKMSDSGLNLIHLGDDSAEKREKLTSMAASLSSHGDAETTLLVGDPASEIKAYLSQNSDRISFVTLSKKRRTRFDEFFFGSLSSAVSGSCRVPLFFIPDDQKFENWKPKKVVVALSLADGTTEALRMAREFSKKMGSKIVLLHTIEMSHALADSGKFFWGTKLDQSDLTAFDTEGFVRKELERHSQSLCLEADMVSVEVRFGSVIEELSNFMEETDADLLIAGSHATSATQLSRMGSVSAALVRTARFPVLVVHHANLKSENGEKR